MSSSAQRLLDEWETLPDRVRARRLDADYLASNERAKEAIQHLVTHWGIDGLLLLEAVARWIEEAE